MAMASDLIKLCIDTYHNRVMNYSKEQANEAIRKAFVEILGTDKPDYRTFRKHKNEIFEIIEVTLDQTITSGYEGNNFFNQFVETRNLALGDTNEFVVEDNSLLAVSKFAGNTWEMRRQRIGGGTSFTVSTDWYGVKIYEYFTRFLSARIEWTTFVNKVQASVDNFIMEMISQGFYGSASYLPSAFKCTGVFDRDAFLTMVEHVQAANRNSEITIVGTRVGLSKLTGNIDATWSDNMKDERNTLGYVRYFEGIPCVVLPQVHKANTFDFAFDNSKLLVLPSNTKPIKLVFEGETLMNETTNGLNRDMSIEYMIQFKLGIATIFNTLYGYAEIA